MKIEKAAHSKINQLDLDTVGFGNAFTDHMLVCEYDNGVWNRPEIVPYAPLSLDPSAQVFHYGQAVFEGMKAYKDAQGEVYLFRPDKNFERINRSAERLAMPAIPKDVFMDGLQALVDLERDWVPARAGMSLYLRPVLFATEPMLMARPSEKYLFLILCSVAGAYYSEPVKVKIANHYSRSAEGGIGFTKAAGNYAASFYPAIEAKKEGFGQVIWTDAATHTFIEEAGTMNLMFRIDDTLVTPPTSEKILPGITRMSIIELAKSKNIPIEERLITVQEVQQAHQQGRLKEAFGVGTAVVVSPIAGIGYPDGTVLDLPVLTDESHALTIKKAIVDIQYHNAPDPFGWLVKVGNGSIRLFV